jgi:hypothetical protein
VYGTLVQGIWFNFEGKNIDIVGSENATEGWIHCKFVLTTLRIIPTQLTLEPPDLFARLVTPSHSIRPSMVGRQQLYRSPQPSSPDDLQRHPWLDS